jgi:hypothetical protein
MLIGATACGGSDPEPQTAAQVDLQEVSRAILGHWVLESFSPEQPLGPPFDQIVASQAGSLRIEVDGQSLHVSGLGFSTVRPYQIVEASRTISNGILATVRLFDASGVAYEVLMRVNGNVIDFEARTSPWRGQGRLHRA